MSKCKHEWKTYFVDRVSANVSGISSPVRTIEPGETSDFSVCYLCHAVNFIPDGSDKAILLEVQERIRELEDVSRET